MSINFNDLGDTLLKGIEYVDGRDIRLKILDKSENCIEATFKNVFWFKVSSSRGNIPEDNEIWIFEEITDSKWIKSIFADSGVYWKEQIIADKYHRTKSVPDPANLHHFVLLSDYIDAEFICTHYSVIEVST